jgi:pimeloyl-ACP methyl ester carboxylesterase
VKVEGAGPAITFIHGFGGAIDWWDDLASELATDHRVIRIDLIGHGGTAAPSSGYAIARQGALVSVILDKLGIDRTTVVGHSMGGEVATALAELRPERIERLIFIDTPHDISVTTLPTTPAQVAKPMPRQKPAPAPLPTRSAPAMPWSFFPMR